VTEVASLAIKVDSRQVKTAEKDLKGLSTAGRATEKSMRGAGTAVKGLVAALGISATIRTVINNTVAQEKAIAQLEQTLKSTGRYTPELSKNMQEFAGALQGVTTFGDEAVIAAQAMLLTFTQIGGPVFGRAQRSILDVATAMGTDLKSATIQVGKALNDPILGINALSRSGIQFSQTQKDVIKQLVETGRVAEAQAVILGELETQFGGSAEAARNTLGGALSALKNSFGDLLEGDSGSDGVRGTTDAINSLTELLSDPATKAAFQEIVTGVLSITTALAEGIVAFAQFGEQIGITLATRFNTQFAIDDIEGLQNKLVDLQGSMALMTERGDQNTNFFNTASDSFDYYTQKLEEAYQFQDQFGTSADNSTKSLADLEAEVSNLASVAPPAIQKLTDAQKAAAKAAQQMFEANENAVKALMFEAETLGWTSEAINLRKLALEGATAAQLADANAALSTIAAYEQQADAMEELKRRQDESGAALSGIRGAVGAQESPLQRLQLEVDERAAIYATAFDTEYINQQEHDMLMLELEGEASAARKKILEEEAQTRQENALQTMSSIVSITQTQVSQLQGLFDEGSAAGKAFYVATQALAAGNAIIQGIMAAQAIRTAYAGMAAAAAATIVGAPAAPGILATGEAHASVAMGMGFASAGMIAAQTVASFDGGGYTGNGPRSGGLDGKGGFMAMMHPQETVSDHTKGQGMGGQQVTNNFIVQGAPDNRTQSQISMRASESQRRVNSRFGK
jgi:hypothetical protein